MNFDFSCHTCLSVVTVKSRIGKAPKVPAHCGHKMQRLYSPIRAHIQWGIADYANRAYDGTEQIPGLTTREVRQTVDMSGRPQP